MDSTSYWLLFFSAAFAINISPGPDLIYILSKTIAQGKKIGIVSSLGVCTGALVHVFAAALGLSAILATSAIAFSIVKYVGAAYLIYLGIQALRSKGISFDTSTVNTSVVDSSVVDTLAKKETKTMLWKAFRQGVLIDILNPKVAIFFMAFLPQFIRPEMGSTSSQMLLLGFLVILVAIIVEFSIVLTAAQTTNFFRKNRHFSIWLDQVLGSILIGLGIRLALTENSNG